MSGTRTSFSIGALAALSALILAACSGSGDTVERTFAPVADATAGSDTAAGTVTLTRTDDATEASIELTGLTPDAEYAAHVHNQPCDTDSGGKHYQFQPGGEEVPPNEIHFALTADAEGAGSAEVKANRKAGPEAVSIVVHYQDKKMLCADLG